jgi:DNA repair exonuclease SbcCD ATPase subunit
MTTEIAKINPAEYGLQEAQVKTIEEAFMPKIIERDGLMQVYETLITEEITPELCVRAKALRLKFVKVRTGIADIHRTQKAFYLAAGRYVDAWKNKETTPIEQVEETLEGIEKYWENIEKERKAKLRAERVAELEKYEVDGSLIMLGEMASDVWENYLAGVKLQYENRKAAERKAEEDRLAAIEAEKKRQEEIRLENERLRKEREELERRQEIERKKLQAEKEKAEKARKEAEAKMLEQAKKDREQLEAARLEKEKAEAELRAKREAEARAQKEAEERAIAEEKARIAAAKKAAAAPDKDKLLKLAEDLKSFPLPQVKTTEAQVILSSVHALILKINSYIVEKTNEL